MANEFIPGPNAVEEALRAGRRLLRVIVSRDGEAARGPLVREARRRRVEVLFADRAALDSLVGKGSHQGIVAVAEPAPPASLEDILSVGEARREQPFIVVLDGVEDPQNLGAVIRSAEAAGAHGLVIPERGAAGVTPAVRRVSAGASEHLKVARVPSLPRALDRLKERGIWVVGADHRAQRSLFEEDLRGPIALVLGGEDRGLGRAAAERCDRLVRIPMKGMVPSLSVSASAAVLLFEKGRQEAAGGGPVSPGVPDRKLDKGGPNSVARK